MTILTLSLVTSVALALHPTYSTPALTNMLAQVNTLLSLFNTDHVT